MQELLPIAIGLVVGSLLPLLRPSIRLLVGAALAVPLGALVTLVTGEFEVSWAFLLVDIPLVAVGAVVGLGAARWARTASRTWRAS